MLFGGVTEATSLDWNRLELILPQAPRSPPIPSRPPSLPPTFHSSQPPYALAVSTRAARSEGEHGSLLIFCGRRGDKFWSHISLFILNSPRATGGLRGKGEGGRGNRWLNCQPPNHNTSEAFLYIHRLCSCSSAAFPGARNHCWWKHRRQPAPAQLINSSIPLGPQGARQGEAGHMTSRPARGVKFG